MATRPPPQAPRAPLSLPTPGPLGLAAPPFPRGRDHYPDRPIRSPGAWRGGVVRWGGREKRGGAPLCVSPSPRITSWGTPFQGVLEPRQGAGCGGQLSGSGRGRGVLLFPVFEVRTIAAPLVPVGRQPQGPQPRLCPPAPAAAYGPRWPPGTRSARALRPALPLPQGTELPASCSFAWNAVHPAEPAASASGLTAPLQGRAHRTRPILQKADTETRVFREGGHKGPSWEVACRELSCRL